MGWRGGKRVIHLNSSAARALFAHGGQRATGRRSRAYALPPIQPRPVIIDMTAADAWTAALARWRRHLNQSVGQGILVGDGRFLSFRYRRDPRAHPRKPPGRLSLPRDPRAPRIRGYIAVYWPHRGRPRPPGSPKIRGAMSPRGTGRPATPYASPAQCEGSPEGPRFVTRYVTQSRFWSTIRT